MEITALISLLIQYGPNLINLVEHYIEIIGRPSMTPEDKEKAEKLLNPLRWEKWDDIK